jgi:hypothetical protein
MPERNAFPSAGFILWSLSAGSEAILINNQSETNENITQIKSDEGFYLLPLTAVEDFYYQYPEHSSIILNYIGIIEH